jgi:hypothetical protein
MYWNIYFEIKPIFFAYQGLWYGFLMVKYRIFNFRNKFYQRLLKICI